MPDRLFFLTLNNNLLCSGPTELLLGSLTAQIGNILELYRRVCYKNASKSFVIGEDENIMLLALLWCRWGAVCDVYRTVISSPRQMFGQLLGMQKHHSAALLHIPPFIALHSDQNFPQLQHTTGGPKVTGMRQCFYSDSPATTVIKWCVKVKG